LWPIKEKYGLGLSWGDLIILAGTTAIESMGGPNFGFCAGRIDDFDGSESYLLGPTELQQNTEPCPVNGNCKLPFGTTTIGLIYLNPEGPMGEPIPEESAPQVRDTFGRMSMDDMETVALIGGGHAFGKTHGACPLGPGLPPDEDPANPWPGACGTGKGNDTFTSGFEGPWTFTPTRWSNMYFTNLLNNQWYVHKGPGDHWQWAVENATTQRIMMLTSDISLTTDASYLSYARLFAANLSLFTQTFSAAWYKLVTRDMGPVTRCVGPWVPPPQPFQNPLPPPPTMFPAWSAVGDFVTKVISLDASNILTPDYINGQPYYGAIFVHLAYQSASSFRHTDYLGGANGGRIRFDPESTWPSNIAMDKALHILNPIQTAFKNLSWADLIVYAGGVALSAGSTTKFSFCPGRTDASNGMASEFIKPTSNFSATVWEMRSAAQLMGLTDEETVVLSGRPRSKSQMERMGYFGSWSPNPATLSNQYFITLLNETWQPYKVMSSGMMQYKAMGKDFYMVQTDLNLLWDTTYMAFAQNFAGDNNYFLSMFSATWTKLMNIDRFAGPTGNVCN